MATKDETLLGETVPADEADSLKGWTVQTDEGKLPEPNAREAPQMFVEEQLPDKDAMEAANLSIPSNQITDDVTVLDPADQVRLGNPDYASPLGITANPEGAHIPGESVDPGRQVADPETPTGDSITTLDTGAAAAPGDTAVDDMTKQQLQDYADSKGYEGVSMSMTKDEMLAAVKEAGG